MCGLYFLDSFLIQDFLDFGFLTGFVVHCIGQVKMMTCQQKLLTLRYLKIHQNLNGD